MTKLAITLAALLLTGCSATTSLTQRSAAEVRQAVTMQDVRENSEIEYSGPPMQATTDGSDHNLYYYNLHAYEAKSDGAIRYQLRIDITYREHWRYYESASFSGGRQVNIPKSDRKILYCVSGTDCMFEETLEVSLDEEQIVSALKDRDRLRLKLKARSGHRSIIEVSSSYLMGFYAAIVNRNG
ncbi:hypothetical protein [Microbulbifer epialgicus]|uniref:Lipoprotein n=1 Tax=Microbulbifer epialgicus TaxID=393907 RepID=A0ABV4P620_9GAMM